MTVADAQSADARSREHGLAAAVIGALLREDYGGLGRWVRRTPAGAELDLPGSGVTVPLEPDGFLADFRVSTGGPSLKLGDVEAVVAAVSDAADADGVAAFGEECRGALAALLLRDEHPPASGVVGPGLAGAAGPGLEGMVGYDALAAVMPHPAYPTSACKLGFTVEDHLRYAPEYRPEFELNWAAVPKTALRHRGDGPAPWWPAMADVGLAASLGDTHGLLPVHPLTARRVPGAIYGAVLAPGTAVRVRPTLSLRTVAVGADPGTHLKLPLPVSTLGLRNRRAIEPGTLGDGALVHRTLTDIVNGDAALGGRLLLADDGTYLHAGHRFLGCLIRRFPRGLGLCHVVPAAGLLAEFEGFGEFGEFEGFGEFGGPGERLVIDRLAEAAGVSVAELAGAWFDLVFGVAVRLFVRYGIALESHQQNAALVLDPSAFGPRLVVKDFDGALINRRRLAAALGPRAPAAAEFADRRMLTDSDEELANVFTTITAHLCAGAIAFGLARRGRAPLGDLLARARQALTAALDEYGDDPAARLLRARVLAPSRLPGKAMLTACTLVDKSRTGARDVNKHIATDGPNYLRLPVPGDVPVPEDIPVSGGGA